jgi:hypothetical protein
VSEVDAEDEDRDDVEPGVDHDVEAGVDGDIVSSSGAPAGGGRADPFVAAGGGPAAQDATITARMVAATPDRTAAVEAPMVIGSHGRRSHRRVGRWTGPAPPDTFAGRAP